MAPIYRKNADGTFEEISSGVDSPDSATESTTATDGEGSSPAGAESDKDFQAYLAWKSKPETVKQVRPEPVPDVVEEKLDHYVHFANGEVRRVAFDDIPTVAGSNAHYGHWQEGSLVHTVIGVYPAEIDVRGK